MKAFSNAMFALLVLAAVPAFGNGVTPGLSNHPLASCDGTYSGGELTNDLGNAICCVHDGTTGTTMCLNNVDEGPIGFNDPAPPSLPATGNPGTSIGQQRVNAYMESFKIWAATVESTETIWVQGTFGLDLFCDEESGTLGAAGTMQIFANFDTAGADIWPQTWYHGALANKLAEDDQEPGSPDPGLLEPPYADDIVSYFNAHLGEEGCLDGSFWYYGFDGNETGDDLDFLAVLTHEVNHGLGMANFVDEGCLGDSNAAGCQPPGSMPLGWPDIYTVFSYDWNSGTHWNQMNDGQRLASGTADELLWDGPNVYAAAPGLLGPGNAVRENSPTSATFRAQESSYSPAPTPGGFTDDVFYWTDPLELTGDSHDACEAYCDPAAASGGIALINRGSCNFNLKSLVAELCGASGVIIANNQPAGLPPMGGDSCEDTYGPTFHCTVVSVGIAKSAGEAIKANIAGGTTNVTILEDASVLAGADRDGFPRLYAPNPVSPGSSISHWDTTLTPNVLMEPFISEDLDVNTTLDLSPYQLMDIGWGGSFNCPAHTNDSGGNIVLDGCDTGVPNDPGPWTLVGSIYGPRGKGWRTTGSTVNGGCYLADLLDACAGNATTHGEYVACVSWTANGLRKIGLPPSDADAIKACAEVADIP